jgi:hypothetical protein
LHQQKEKKIKKKKSRPNHIDICQLTNYGNLLF